MTWLVRNRLLFFFVIFFLLSGSTYFLIQIARGYRFDPQAGELKAHGLLAIKSKPDGAKIYINGVLKGATNTTMALLPGKYQVDVEMDGFSRWTKVITINKELVTQADIFLFSLTPVIQPLTYDGITKLSPSPDGSFLAYVSSATTLGVGESIWAYPLTGGLLDFNRQPRLLVDKISSLVGTKSYQLSWSPDGKWLIVTAGSNQHFLISPSQLNGYNDVLSRSANYAFYSQQWDKTVLTQKVLALKKLPETIADALTQKAGNIVFSPDGTKVLYQATDSAKLNSTVTPPVTASTQAENRQIASGNYYVYDLKEDKNFLLPYSQTGSTPTPKVKIAKTQPNTQPHWLPNSNHLFWVEIKNAAPTIVSCEYDGKNTTPLYAGSFDPASVFTENTMGKIIFMSTQNTEANIFSLDLTH